MGGGELTNYDAHGLIKGRLRGYGIFVRPVPPLLEEEYNEKLHIQETDPDNVFLRVDSGKGPLPYSNHDVYRRDFSVCGSLSGNREYLKERLNDYRIPVEIRNEALRVMYDHHPTWATVPVVGLLLRIETWELLLKYNDVGVYDQGEDEPLDVEAFKMAAQEEEVWDSERVTIRAEDCVDSDGERKACSVCSEEYSVGMDATKMPCSHVFHSDCIVTWFNSRCFCPICSFKLMSVAEFEHRLVMGTLPHRYGY